MGYIRIYWYREGLKGWEEAGLPTGKTIDLMQQEPVAGISPQELQEKLAGSEGVFLLDIRDDNSRAQFGAIPGKTLHYPLFRLHKLYSELPRNRNLVVYDIRGKQAPIAFQYLLTVHFDPAMITWLDGGVENWKKSGFASNSIE